jgi:MYXO-CTERM domain-containing protein
LALIGAPAFCTVLPYADRASWLSATSSVATQNFDALTPGSYSNTTGLILPDASSCPTCLTFVAPYSGSDFLWVSSNYAAVDSRVLYWQPTPGYLKITLPTPVYAIALDLWTYNGSGTAGVANSTFNLAWTGGSLTSNATASNGYVFVGFTSDVAISSFTVSLPTAAQPLLQDLSYGSLAQGGGPSDAPEVCTWIMIASGLVGIAGWRRRKRGGEAQPA